MIWSGSSEMKKLIEMNTDVILQACFEYLEKMGLKPMRKSTFRYNGFGPKEERLVIQFELEPEVE